MKLKYVINSINGEVWDSGVEFENHLLNALLCRYTYGCVKQGDPILHHKNCSITSINQRRDEEELEDWQYVKDLIEVQFKRAIQNGCFLYHDTIMWVESERGSYAIMKEAWCDVSPKIGIFKDEKDYRRVRALCDISPSTILLSESPAALALSCGQSSDFEWGIHLFTKAMTRLDPQNRKKYITNMEQLQPRCLISNIHHLGEIEYINQYSLMWTAKLKANKISIIINKSTHRKLDLVYCTLHSFNHSCCPNAILDIKHGIGRIITIRPIKLGDEITYSYIPFGFDNQSKRMEIIKQYLGFDCNCNACNHTVTPDTSPWLQICNINPLPLKNICAWCGAFKPDIFCEIHKRNKPAETNFKIVKKHFRMCSSCTHAHYCSRSCQSSHWKTIHKITCTPKHTS